MAVRWIKDRTIEANDRRFVAELDLDNHTDRAELRGMQRLAVAAGVQVETQAALNNETTMIYVARRGGHREQK